jgi:hypothetical protein
MEGLAYDFGGEKEEKDKDTEAKPEKPAKIELIGSSDEDSAEKPRSALSELLLKTTLEKNAEKLNEEPADLNPELEAEASVEHLNEPEIVAVAQTIATDRLSEIKAEEKEVPESADLAAESFLENVQASGDIDQSFRETMEELGEASMETAIPVEVGTETAPPVDPESLIEAARQAISPHVNYELPKHELPKEESKEQTEKSWNLRRTKAVPEKQKKERSESKPVTESITDYIIGRRYGRLNPEASHIDVEKTLKDEVIDIKRQLASHETHVRQIAKNKGFEKRPEDVVRREQTKQETISINALKPERVDEGSRLLGKEENRAASKREIAGISAHTMERDELLHLAGEIKVGDSNLRETFDKHLIGEKGLRRVVAEFLRGGEYRLTLRRELLEKEKDFERDPKLRDQGSTQPVFAQSTQLDNLLQKSGIDWSEPAQTILPNKPLRSTKMPAIVNNFKGKSGLLKRVADVVLLALILILAAAVVYVLMKR